MLLSASGGQYKRVLNLLGDEPQQLQSPSSQHCEGVAVHVSALPQRLGLHWAASAMQSSAENLTHSSFLHSEVSLTHLPLPHMILYVLLKGQYKRLLHVPQHSQSSSSQHTEGASEQVKPALHTLGLQGQTSAVKLTPPKLSHSDSV